MGPLPLNGYVAQIAKLESNWRNSNLAALLRQLLSCLAIFVPRDRSAASPFDIVKLILTILLGGLFAFRTRQGLIHGKYVFQVKFKWIFSEEIKGGGLV